MERLVIAVSIVFVGCLTTVIGTVEVTVKTKYGLLRGTNSDKSQIFLGIPYASPPKRWRDASEPASWEGTMNATKVKPMCYQPKCRPTMKDSCVDEMSEDCLYLNVFAPLNTKATDNKAVMVWMHGGAFIILTGSAPTFNGEQFVKTGDVVLVTINYRLGAFGFLMTGTSDDSPKGNYGIRDQRLALKWVKENIKSFGGNPNKVTIFGESAGASSVMAHLISKQSSDLYQKAIIQSAPLGIQFKSLNVAKKQGKHFLEDIGCADDDDDDDTKCLRSKSAEAIIAVQKTTKPGTGNFIDAFMPWGPCVDGIDISYKALAAAESGNLPNIPLMIGTTYDETVDMIYKLFKCPISSKAFNLMIGAWKHFGKDARSILKEYRPEDKADARPELIGLSTEVIFTCPTRQVAKNFAATGNIWMYVFNQSKPIQDLTPGTPSCATHACHAAEVPFVFNSFEKINLDPSAFDLQLADAMVAFWTNFAKTGDPNPNGKAMPKWQRYQLTGENKNTALVFISGNIHSIVGYRDEICDFWDDIGYD